MANVWKNVLLEWCLLLPLPWTWVSTFFRFQSGFTSDSPGSFVPLPWTPAAPAIPPAEAAPPN